MGVPKFFRWISERYPCLSEVVKDDQIPDFDNLYLDMNGIIHVCSHPEDDNVKFRITESAIFEQVTHYIEFLFQMIKPQKVFFMAVDGVAPRAKMNQQRSRRFRSAKTAEEQEKAAIDKGIELPDTQRFDSNCITPGTEFMSRLNEYMKYFVIHKISTDPLWRCVRVIFSGHEVPGEGEHKIQDFIRSERSRSDYNPNTRHCLYGLDADLVMLGLASHEPYFSLLREKVTFGKKKSASRRVNIPEEASFFLLHLSILRDYIDMEFQSLKSPNLLSFPYDLERIIDDWILIGFLVGNDFIPHLPNLHIHADALPLLWDAYKETLTKCTGYLHEHGDLNVERFQKMLQIIAEKDRANFFGDQGDWMAGADGSRLANAVENLGLPQEEELPTRELTGFFDDDVDGDSVHSECLEGVAVATLPICEAAVDEDEYAQHRRYYYTSKLGIEMNEDTMREQTRQYLLAIQWILLYYFRGVPSWSWYYPQHYAPFVSDIIMALSSEKQENEYGLLNADWLRHCREDHESPWKCNCNDLPFLPFQQLMAVLPAGSSNLLPQSYKQLMLDEHSAIYDFYPNNFDSDLNGKKQEWEAVVLIPFIQEQRLLTALNQADQHLSSQERQRNKHGPHLSFRYVNHNLPPYYCDTNALGLNTILQVDENHAVCEELPMDAFYVTKRQLAKGILPGCNYQKVLTIGFPSLYSLRLKSAHLERVPVKIFEFFSRSQSMLLELEPSPVDNYTLNRLENTACDLLGKVIFVQWPFLKEGRLETIRSSTYEYCLDTVSGIICEALDAKEREDAISEYKSLCKNLKQDRAICIACENSEPQESLEGTVWQQQNGISSSIAWLLVGVRLIVGREYRFENGLLKRKDIYSTNLETFLWNQCWLPSLKNIEKNTIHHEIVITRLPKELQLKHYFSEGDDVLCVQAHAPNSGFGCFGKVVGKHRGHGNAAVIPVILYDYSNEPNLQPLIPSFYEEEQSYVTANVISTDLQRRLSDLPQCSLLSPVIVARLTGDMFLCLTNDKRCNIGLNLKINRQDRCALGYTRKIAVNRTQYNGQRSNSEAWLYCKSRVVDILEKYFRHYPDLLDILTQQPNANTLKVADIVALFPNQTVEEIYEKWEKFVTDLDSNCVPRVHLRDSYLSADLLNSLNHIVTHHVKTQMYFTKRQCSISPDGLFKFDPRVPGATHAYSLGETHLLDRIVHVRTSTAVPFGMRGTIVGVIAGPPNKYHDWFYEILFDMEFADAIDIRGISGRGYRLKDSSFLNLSSIERECFKCNLQPLGGKKTRCPFQNLLSSSSETSEKVDSVSKNIKPVVAAPPPPRPMASFASVAAATVPSPQPPQVQMNNNSDDDVLRMLNSIDISSLLTGEEENDMEIAGRLLPATTSVINQPATQILPPPPPPPPGPPPSSSAASEYFPALPSEERITSALLSLCDEFDLNHAPSILPIVSNATAHRCQITVEILPKSFLESIPLPLVVNGLLTPNVEAAYLSAIEECRKQLQAFHRMSMQQSASQAQQFAQQHHHQYQQQQVRSRDAPMVQQQQQQQHQQYQQYHQQQHQQQYYQQQHQQQPQQLQQQQYKHVYIPPTYKDNPFGQTYYSPVRDKMFDGRRRYQCGGQDSQNRGNSTEVNSMNTVGGVASEESVGNRPGGKSGGGGGSSSTMFIPSQITNVRRSGGVVKIPPSAPLVYAPSGSGVGGGGGGYNNMGGDIGGNMPKSYGQGGQKPQSSNQSRKNKHPRPMAANFGGTKS